MAAITKTPNDSFRVPNSIIQGMTTSIMGNMEAAPGLSRLTAFQIVTLLGLLTRVPPKQAMEEVRSTVSELLEIIEVSRHVAHAVEREWETADGTVKRRRYLALRRNPKYLKMIHDALLVLHSKTVVIRRADAKNRQQVTDRVVHLLDSFGYVYERFGKQVDLHDLPIGSEKVNVGAADRPVWKVLQTAEDGDRFERPVGILFRLNTELASELTGARGTIGYTLIARKVFALFKRYMKTPAAIRLIFLILRQTEPVFTRRLWQMLEDLGFDVTHPQRAVGQLTDMLDALKESRLVEAFEIDLDKNKLEVHWNRTWYQEETKPGGLL